MRCVGRATACVSMRNEYRKTIHKYCPLSARLEKQYPIAGMHTMLREGDCDGGDERGAGGNRMQVNDCRCQGVKRRARQIEK